MGADGTGGGWYDPTVGTTITTNRPADPSPHWEATGTGVNIGGANRIVDFTLTGEGGAFETTTTPSAQQYRFTPSGTPGQRVEVSGPRQEITNFTFSGTSSNATGTAGLPDIWDIEVTGTSDAGATGTSEEFFIYLTGNSSTATSQDIAAGDAITAGTVIEFTFDLPSSFFDGSYNRVQNITLPNIRLRQLNSILNFQQIFGQGISAPTQAYSDVESLVTYIQDHMVGLQQEERSSSGFGTSSELIRATQVDNDTFTVAIEITSVLSGVTIDNTNIGNGTLAVSRVGGGGTNFTLTTPTGTLPQLAGEQSFVQISIPTESINETFELTGGLTTATALRDDLLTLVSTNTNITNEFSVMAATADAGTTGVTIGEPIITLLANDNTDHTVGVTFNNGDDGDLSGSAFGSHVEGDAGSASTEIRITYDADITPSFQDIVLGGTADSEATASVLSSMINGHGGLTSRVIGTEVGDLFQGENDELDLDYNTAVSTNLGVFTYTTGQSASTNAARAEGIAEPTTRPDNGFIVIQYNAQTTDNFDEEIELAFPGVRTIGTELNLTDVSLFNRRLLVDTGNFTASYFIQRVAVAGNDSRLQYFEITGGRDVDAQEQLILDAIPRNRVGPDAITIISSEQDTIVRVTTTVRDNLDQPTITTTTAGTTQNPPTFTISTFQDGEVPVPGLGTLSSYSISYAGTEVVASTALPASSTAAQVSGLISAAVNSLNTHTTTGTNPFTATSVANSADNLVVTITRGQNSDLSVPTIAVARNVTQEGDADSVFGGSDGTVEPLVGNRSLGVINIAGMSLNDIAIAVGQAYANDGAYLGQTTGPELEITAQFTGTMNPATVNVNAGTNSDGTAANFVIARTVIDDGQGTTVTTGSAASYIILLDTTQVATGTFASNVSSSAVVTTLVNALTAVESFSGSANGDTLRATSSTPTRMPDITITVTPGTDADGTPGTLAISKTVVQEGVTPRVDYSTTVWSYYVINQEVRVDDDTTMMGDNNQIQVRRGLIQQTNHVTFFGEPGGIDLTQFTPQFRSWASQAGNYNAPTSPTTSQFWVGGGAASSSIIEYLGDWGGFSFIDIAYDSTLVLDTNGAAILVFIDSSNFALFSITSIRRFQNGDALSSADLYRFNLSDPVVAVGSPNLPGSTQATASVAGVSGDWLSVADIDQGGWVIATQSFTTVSNSTLIISGGSQLLSVTSGTDPAVYPTANVGVVAQAGWVAGSTTADPSTITNWATFSDLGEQPLNYGDALAGQVVALTGGILGEVEVPADTRVFFRLRRSGVNSGLRRVNGFFQVLEELRQT